MFKNKLYERLLKEKEIEISRLQNRYDELLEKVISLTENGLRSVSANKKAVSPIEYIDMVTGDILDMTADTEEAKRQKSEALASIPKLLGH